MEVEALGRVTAMVKPLPSRKPIKAMGLNSYPGTCKAVQMIDEINVERIDV